MQKQIKFIAAAVLAFSCVFGSAAQAAEPAADAAALAASLSAAVFAGSAAAAQSEAGLPATTPTPPGTGSRKPLGPPPGQAMTGDWGGLRTRLRRRGVTVTANYLAESAARLSGGKEGGAAYTQEANVAALLDLGRLIGLTGGSAKIGFADRWGEGLQKHIGSVLLQQGLNNGRGGRLSEASYAQDLAGGALNLKLGLVHTSDDFASSPINCNFQNSNFCPRPPLLMTDSGFSGYPTPHWGVRLRWKATARFTFQTGVYEDNSRRGQPGQEWGLGLSTATGAFIPVELAWTRGGKGAALPGTYRIGAYYDTARTADVLDDINGASLGLTGKPARLRDGRHGGWAMGEQMVWRKGTRSLTVFANLLAGDRATAKYGGYGNVGLVMKGPFAARPQDSAGVAFGDLEFNDRLTQAQIDKAIRAHSVHPAIQTHEGGVEAFYGIQARPWLLLRPNLQYVIRPGAAGRYRNAFVAGFAIRAAL